MPKTAKNASAGSDVEAGRRAAARRAASAGEPRCGTWARVAPVARASGPPGRRPSRPGRSLTKSSGVVRPPTSSWRESVSVSHIVSRRPVLVVDQTVVGRDAVPGRGELSGERVASARPTSPPTLGRDPRRSRSGPCAGFMTKSMNAAASVLVRRLAGDVERERERRDRDDLARVARRWRDEADLVVAHPLVQARRQPAAGRQEHAVARRRTPARPGRSQGRWRPDRRSSPCRPSS